MRLHSDSPILARQRLTLSSALQIYIAKIAREKRIPFEISAVPFYSPEINSSICSSDSNSNDL